MFNDERGMDKRAAFLVDGEGKIRWAKVYDAGTIPESSDLLAQIRQL